jgi:hypothetical protein
LKTIYYTQVNKLNNHELLNLAIDISEYLNNLSSLMYFNKLDSTNLEPRIKDQIKDYILRNENTLSKIDNPSIKKVNL